MQSKKGYLLSPENTQIPLLATETTIGRIPTNTISINHPTISKNHAIFTYLQSQNKFYLKDLHSINGTYVNGQRVGSGGRVVLKHKDCIQFGKEELYTFCRRDQGEKKDRIKLKDYFKELEDSLDGSQQIKKDIVQTRQQNFPKREQIKSNINNQKSQTNTNFNQKSYSKLKIPDMSEYLQLEQSLMSSYLSEKKQPEQQKSRYSKKIPKETRVQLPQYETQSFGQKEYNILKHREKEETNRFLEKQQREKLQEEEVKKLKEDKIKLQIEKIKQEEHILRKQMEMEEKLRDEEEKMYNERQKIKQELLRKEQQRRIVEERKEREQTEKEKKLIQEMRQEKERQLSLLKQHQEQLRNQNQFKLKNDYESRKRELEVEAKALTQQYEQIYLQTIKKMKTDIEKQQNQINTLESQIEKYESENQDFQQKTTEVSKTRDKIRYDYLSVCGRNKAFILYASQLQNKIDQNKREIVQNEKQNRVVKKMREDLTDSRKLLYIKTNQIKSYEEEIKKLKLQLSMGQNTTDAIDTIMQNHKNIQSNKSYYYEYLKDEKHVEELWEAELADVDDLSQKNATIAKEIHQNKKQLQQNMKDNIKKLCDQRLHMLKNLHYMSEEKKKAAKFLLEEMLVLEEQIKNLVIDTEDTHDKIHKIITRSEYLKQQNEDLSQLLFGYETTSHHFDNMKIEINQLIERIEQEKDPKKIVKKTKTMDDIQRYELKIYEEIQRNKKLKEQWRTNMLSNQVILADKNPIVFFGDVLMKKQMELENNDKQIRQYEIEREELMKEVGFLESKKNQAQDLLEQYKNQELAKVRQGMLY